MYVHQTTFALLQPDIEILNSVDPSGDGVPVVSNVPATVNPEASLYLAKTMASESTDYDDGESDEATLKKRRFVYKELISTEEDYIKDLKTVIDVSGTGNGPWPPPRPQPHLLIWAWCMKLCEDVETDW
jgi:hypothetical protein